MVRVLHPHDQARRDEKHAWPRRPEARRRLRNQSMGLSGEDGDDSFDEDEDFALDLGVSEDSDCDQGCGDGGDGGDGGGDGGDLEKHRRNDNRHCGHHHQRLREQEQHQDESHQQHQHPQQPSQPQRRLYLHRRQLARRKQQQQQYRQRERHHQAYPDDEFAAVGVPGSDGQ